MKWASNKYEEHLQLTAGLAVIQYGQLTQNSQAQEPKMVLICTSYSVYHLANLNRSFMLPTAIGLHNASTFLFPFQYNLKSY